MRSGPVLYELSLRSAHSANLLAKEPHETTARVRTQGSFFTQFQLSGHVGKSLRMNSLISCMTSGLRATEGVKWAERMEW